MTNQEALKIAYSKRKDSAGEERDFLNTIIQALKQEPILDKIRAEIIENSIEDYKYHGCGSDELIIDTSLVLEIIDKYKAESEVFL